MCIRTYKTSVRWSEHFLAQSIEDISLFGMIGIVGTNCLKVNNAAFTCSLQVEKEQMETAMVIEDDGQRQQSKKQKLKASMMPTNQNTVGVGKTSGRSWKISGQKASSMRSGASKNMSTSWEKKMRDKAVLKEVRDRRREALEKEKAKRREAREKREAAKKRKEENRKKSAVTQVVSTETAKKMAKNKKLRKKLVTVDG